MAEVMVKIQELKKTYGSAEGEVHALRGISFDIQKGEAVSMMGQSGSGKSTLLSIMGALNPPTTGKVEIDGIDIYALSQERRADFRREYLGFVFQQFQLIPYLTAMENVLLPLVTTRFSSRQKREMAEQVLCRVGLAGKMHRLPNALSGGEQERVAIARALVNRPPLILADEPTGNLDSKTGEEIMMLFRKLNEDGLTVLMVTHNPDNTRYMGRTIVLKDGLICHDKAEILALAASRGKRRGG
jgi:putative ABC transport system ATP-binding protein